MWGLTRQSDTPTDVLRLRIGQLDIQPFSDIAISPDGTRIVYEGPDGRLNLHTLDQLAPVPLPGTEGAGNVFFLPDGEWVGFQRMGHRLHKVSIFGGMRH